MYSRAVTRWDIVGGVCVLLFGASFWWLMDAEPDAPPADVALLDPSVEVQLGDEWMGLYFGSARAGLMHLRKRARDGGGYLFSLRTRLRMQALGADAAIDTEVQAALDAGLTLERFTFDVSAGPARFKGEGEVQGTTVALTMDTGGERVERRIELSRAPVLNANLGPMLTRSKLEPGQTMSFQVFDPMTLKDRTVEIEVVGPDTVVAFGREVPATHIRQKVAGITLNGWINQRGEMLRQELGLGLVARRESEEEARWGLAQARSGRAAADIAEATMVKVDGLPPRVEKLRRLTLEVGGVDLSEFDLSDARQVFAEGRLVITREVVGKGAQMPVLDSNLARYLAPEPLVQSDHPRIVARATDVVGETRDTVEAARKIRAWVHGAVEQKSVVGVPSALETLEKRVGDCNEHATLFAALGRAAGVPTRIAVGLVYQEGRFGYHAWNEVWTADGWLSVDPTWDQSPVDVGHLRVVYGNIDQQVLLLQIIGRITLDVVAHQ